ncbi:MAG: glycosyltransferase family 4 protein [bacterium]|nr:glycosyltransferase family 4 protein [bacterium]
MRIGINTLFLLPGKVGGTETYVRGLLYGLTKIDSQNEYILFTNRENHDSFDFKLPNFKRILCNFSSRIKATRVFWEQAILPKLGLKERIDLLHSPGYVGPLSIDSHTIVTIPDMQYKYYPENFSTFRLWYWQYFIPRSAKKADRIITLSEYSKKDIAMLLNIPRDKIIVTYPASKFDIFELSIPSNEKIQTKYNLKAPFILSVASLLPHKNFKRLLEAYARIADQCNVDLVLVGLKLQSLSAIQEHIKQYKINPNRVLILGYIGDPDLAGLYQLAELVVHPSLFEGFGIPVVEAMKFGCPVIAANRTALPEIIGDAGLLIDPENPQAIAEAIHAILTQPVLRKQLIEKGYQRAKLFVWEKMAKTTLDAYIAVVNG